MTAHGHVEEAYTEAQNNPRHAIRNTRPISTRLAWGICASISVLSARHLLVEQNLHYPLQLYFSQLAIAGTIALGPFWTRHGSQAPFREWPKSQAANTRATVLVATSACFMWLSTICTLQAILHFQNLPTLVMITSIAVFAESLFLLIARIVPPTRTELLRTGLLFLASVGLLSTEYRLNVPSIVASVFAMLFAGVARALLQTVARSHPEAIADNINHAGRFVGMGALVGVLWVLVFWTRHAMYAFDLESLPLLLTYALSSALAMTLGKSILFPMDEEVADTVFWTGSVEGHHNFDFVTIAILTGIVGCHSTLSTRRSYTNIYQFGCFLLAMMCISRKAYIGFIDAQPQRSRINPRTYELVDVPSRSSVDNSDTTDFVRKARPTRMPAFLSSLQANKMLRKPFLGASIALLWIAYGGLNFIERPDPHVPALLDREYVPQVPVEIVLSMYKEPVHEVRKLLHNLKSIASLSDAYSTIYIKDSEADIDVIKKETGADRVTIIPNVGREGETYLNHILDKWQSLAKQTVFLQADIHNPREFYTHVKNYYSRNQTGYLNLGWSGAVCNCADCGDKLWWQDNAHFVPQLHSRIFNSTETACNNILLSYKGQFVVSAARIRGIDKAIYHDLWQAFVDEKSWAHQPEFLQGRPDSMSAPDFGYTVERIWNILFQCSNYDVAWKCPSLVSGWRIGGDIHDCQCFDG